MADVRVGGVYGLVAAQGSAEIRAGGAYALVAALESVEARAGGVYALVAGIPTNTATVSVSDIIVLIDGAMASNVNAQVGALFVLVDGRYGDLIANGDADSLGSAKMTALMSMKGDGTSSSDGINVMRLVQPDTLRLAQIGLSMDVTSLPALEVTQVGAQADLVRVTPVEMTQAGAQLDATRVTPIEMSQVGAQIDVSQIRPLELTAVALQIDGRVERPETELNCWEVHIEDRIGHHFAILENAYEVGYLETLSDCGGGSFKIPALDAKATSTIVCVGNVVKLRYRNRDIGAWVIENITEGLVGQGEGAERILTVSGRGLLSTLEYGIVYPADTTNPETAERSFTDVTPAEIFLTLYQEFVSRGGGWFIPDFYPATDSDGQAWPNKVTLKFRAGQTLLDVARQLSAYGFEFTTHPDKTLQAWVSAGQDRSSVVAFRHGLNIVTASSSISGASLANAVLGEGQGLYLETEDAAGIVARHRREYYLRVGNTNDVGQLGTANALMISSYKDPPISFQVMVTAWPQYPFFDYHVGDVVHLSIPGEVDADYRILAINVQDGQDKCDLRVTLELNSLQAEYLAKLQRALAATLQGIQPSPGATSSIAVTSTDTGVTGTGVGLGTRSIKQNHIDFGLDPDQISADNIPIADVGNYFGGTVVEDALQETLLSNGTKPGASSQAQWFGNGVYAGSTAQYTGIDQYGAYIGGSHFPRKSVYIPASAMMPDPSAPPTPKTYYGAQMTWSFKVQDFYMPDYEYMYFQAEMPHDWREGSRIYPYVRWLGTVDGNAQENVGWALEYTMTDAGGVYGFGYDTLIGGTTGLGPAGTFDAWTPPDNVPDPLTWHLYALRNYSCPVAGTVDMGIDATGQHIRSNFTGRLSRHTVPGMLNYNHDAFLLGVEIVYDVDYIAGSRGAEEKWSFAP